MARPDHPGDRWKSIFFSVLLHGVIVALIGYSWWTFRPEPQPDPTLAIEGVVVDARELESTPVRSPEPEPAPEPAPVPPSPPQPTPEEIEREQQQRLEAERIAAERRAREEAEREARLAQERARAEAQARAAEEQRLVEEKRLAEERRLAEEKRLAEERRRQEEARRQEEERRKAEEARLAEQRRQEELKRQAEERRKAEEARLLAEREAELRRRLAEEERLRAMRSGSEFANWQAQIQARIQRAWIRPPSAQPGIECDVHVTQVPGGEVVNVRVGQCNGDQAVRESIEAAVYRASPLPPPPDPALFERNLVIVFKPRD